MALGSLRNTWRVFLVCVVENNAPHVFNSKYKYPFVAFLYIFFFFFFCSFRCLRPRPGGTPPRLPLLRNLLVTPSNSGGVRRYLWQGRLRRQGGFWDPGKNAMPAADLHASTGSLHIIKARGCMQWLHLRPSPHRRHRGAPHTDLSLAVFVSAFCLCRERGREGVRERGRMRERWERDKIYACMRWNSFLGGEGMKLLRQRRANLFARLSNRAAMSSKPESVMDVHAHVVSK